jgi:hypothetical protein
LPSHGVLRELHGNQLYAETLKDGERRIILLLRWVLGRSVRVRWITFGEIERAFVKADAKR